MTQVRSESLLPEVLGRGLGTEVTVGLKDGHKLCGKLHAHDLYMNLVLDDTVELEGNRVRKRYGLLFIRGDCVVFVILA